ncbi:MAG: hypothetical protein R3A48_03700 [Polyangiales bacterium]
MGEARREQPVFLFVVDTEGDNEWTRHRRLPPLRNLQALPRFQSLCDRYGVRPTYVVTWSITQCDEAVSMLRAWERDGRCEIGAHLHPWTTPPWSRLDDSPAFPSELDTEVLAAKLRALTEAITERFGRAPTSYRAGRYGADGRTARLLGELGYTCDSSVTPLVSWKGCPGLREGPGGPDFSRAPLDPYFPSVDDLSREGELSLVEIPISIVDQDRLPFGFGDRLAARHEACLLRRAASWLKLRRRMWLRPTLEGHADMVAACEVIRARGGRHFNMMIHSSELYPNTSPYFESQRDIDGLFDRMDRCLDAISRRYQPEPLTLTEAAHRLRAQRGLAA